MKRLVALLLLLVVLCAADRGAEQVAEGVLAAQVGDELRGSPSVEIGGWPFLTQALAGRYEAIDVRGDGLRQAGLEVRDVAVRLEGVQVPLSSVVGGDITSVPVDRLSGRVRVPYGDLADAAAQRGITLRTEGDRVRVTARLTLLGQSVEASALSRVAVEGDELVVGAQDYQVAGQALTGALRRAVDGRLDVRVPLPVLPYGLRVTGVQVAADGVDVQAASDGAVLTR